MRMIFNNDVVNKKKLQNIMYLTFQNYGAAKSSLIADRVKNLTFHYATISGISLSLEDLRIPFKKRKVIGLTNVEIGITEQNYESGKITIVERFQKIIDIWNNTSNSLKNEVVFYFRESDPFNPLYIMAFSGARGNISQVRQLVGMRGLMANPQGEIIDLPIRSNFREGLKVSEYIISSYGARKGLVDTALRTADSGYLTRRLVDIAHSIIVREENCFTSEGLTLPELFKKFKNALNFEDRLIGRLLAKPVEISKKKLVIPSNTEVNRPFINQIIEYKLGDICVRSPLTCESSQAVCRYCYGWHLAYSKIVDLGEAVGILAAQSIGEPGTQLTMRTFHTGGVFSAELAKQIRSPFRGTLKYELKSNTPLVRTIHGDRGFNLLESIRLYLKTKTNTICSVEISRDSLLLLNNEQKLYGNQVIAETKKEANLTLEEDQKAITSEFPGEVFFKNITIEEVPELVELKTKKKYNCPLYNNKPGTRDLGLKKRITQKDGIVWVLAGDIYSLSKSFTLNFDLEQQINPNETIIKKNILNRVSGIIDFSNFPIGEEVHIIKASMTVENGLVRKNEDGFDVLELKAFETTKLFHLIVTSKQIIKRRQRIACLNDETYKTDTGGIVYYSIGSKIEKKKRDSKPTFKGFLYLVPEETYYLDNFNIETLNVKIGDYVKKGKLLFRKRFSNEEVTATLDGYVQINETNTELTIKPGYIQSLKKATQVTRGKFNQFIKPETPLCLDIAIDQLSYIEYLKFNGTKYLLIRPVITYFVPKKRDFFLKYRFSVNLDNRCLKWRTLKQLFYKDGQRVTSQVRLIETYLCLDLRKKYENLYSKFELIPFASDKNFFKLKMSVYEKIKNYKFRLKNSIFNKKIYLKKDVGDYQYVYKGTKIAQVRMVSNSTGLLTAANKLRSISMLFLEKKFLKLYTCKKSQETILVKRGDLVRVGTYLTSEMRSSYAGQILKIVGNTIYIRLGRPYRISSGTDLLIKNKSFVNKGDIFATLVYEKLKTVDIVQGLPKVEQLLEARQVKNGCFLSPSQGRVFFKPSIDDQDFVRIVIEKSPFNIPEVRNIKQNEIFKVRAGEFVNFLQPLTAGPISSHDMLETLFNYYQKDNTIHLACKKSFKYLQLFLLNEVQRTYVTQGVTIADKHIEIIVKQMTSKVLISDGGDTTLLPGEILEMGKVELIRKLARFAGEKPPLYKPIVLGLTKASLKSDSFISAASFQETTQVLTEAAIEGKKDWLYGLKENVIIGRLIPAGTAFNIHENSPNINKLNSSVINNIKQNTLKSAVLNLRMN